MTPRSRLRAPLVGLTLVAVFARADDPAPADKGRDAAADPLPKGAKARFGSARMAFRTGGTVLLPPDYTTFLVADPADGVRRYDLATGRPLDKGAVARTPGTGGPGGAYGQVVVSADGRRAVVGRTGVLSVREVATGAEVQQLRPVGGFSASAGYPVPTEALSADGKVLAQGGTGQGGKAEAVVWNVDKNEVMARLNMAYNGSPIPTLSPDGKVLATRSYGPYATPGSVAEPVIAYQVWDVTTGKVLFTPRPTGYGNLLTAVFSPDGGTLALAAADGPVDLWDVKTGEPARTLLGRTGQGARVAFSPDGKAVAAVATDGTVQRWATADGRLLGVTEPPAVLPTVAPLGLGFADNDRLVAWGRVGQVVVAWEAASGKLLTALGEHTGAVQSIGFGAGGKEVVTAGLDGRVLRWDAATGKPIGAVTIRRPPGGGGGPLGVGLTISPDATRGVSAGFPVSVFDLATGAELFAVPRPHPTTYTTYPIPSPDGTRVVTVTPSYSAKALAKCAVWDVIERRRLAAIDLPGIAAGRTPTAALSPDGTRLVVAGSARDPITGRLTPVIVGWDLKRDRKLGEVEDPTGGVVTHLAVVNDTSVVVSSGGRLWAADYEGGRAGAEIDIFRNRGEGSTSPVVFSPDGKRFATGVLTEAPGVYGVRVYDWPRGKVLHTFAGHAGPVTALTFTPDGKFLASGSSDTTAILWDMSELNVGK